MTVVKKSPLKGKKRGPLSEEVRAKISASMKGQKRGPMSDETKAKLSESMKGHKMSKATKEKISASMKGKERGPRGLKLHCGKCKTKQPIRKYTPTEKAGKPAVYAECKVCGAKIFSWGSRK